MLLFVVVYNCLLFISDFAVGVYDKVAAIVKGMTINEGDIK